MSLQVLGYPFQCITVADLLGDAAHVYCQRPLSIFELVLQAQTLSQLFFWNCLFLIDFVAEYHDRHLRQAFSLQHVLKFDASLLKSFFLAGIDKEDNCVDACEVVPPGLASCLMSSEIPCRDGHVTDVELFSVRLQCWWKLCHLIFLQSLE